MNINVTIFGQIISFAFFIWFCMKYVWGPLISIIEKRQKDISNNLMKSRNTRIESERIFSAAQDCLVQSKVKAKEIIRSADVYGEQIINVAKYNADQERHKILCQARNQAMLERAQIIEDLRKELGKLIVESTKKIIECSLDEKINQNIIDNIVTKLSCEDKN